MRVLGQLMTLLVMLGVTSPARAAVSPGDVAPNFTKNELAGVNPNWTTGPARSLSDYAGKVVVLFLLGYN